MSTEPLNLQPGFYGKIPSHGDFVRHHLPRSFIDPWDTWLQTALHQSKSTLGGSWLDAYLTSPIYRYILTPGICGNHQWMGLIMPSVDSIGRYFPFTVSIPVSSPANSFHAIQQYQDWFTRAEEIIRKSLEDNFDYEQFIKDVDSLSIPAKDQAETDVFELPGTLTGEPLLIQHELSVDEDLTVDYPNLMDEILRETCFAYSIWLTNGSDEVAPNLIVSQGLPLSQYFSCFFTGNWKQRKESLHVHNSS